MNVEVNTRYEASKLAHERYAEYFANHYDMSMAGMQFFSVYQGYRDTEGHKGEYANVIAQFADDLANGEAPVIYGDGTQTRDFTHVSDIVCGLELAAEHEHRGVYNPGTGEAYDFNTVVEMINEELETDVEPEYVENYSKIREETAGSRRSTSRRESTRSVLGTNGDLVRHRNQTRLPRFYQSSASARS